MYLLEEPAPAQSEVIAAFIEHVILASVDASPAEKAAFVANTRKNLNRWTEAPAHCLHLAALSGANVVGVVLVRDFWNLCHLFVAPEHQGRGLGRQLLEAAIAGCAGRSPRACIRLNSSRNAVGFYEHMGFAPVPDAPAHLIGVQFERRL